MPFSSLLIAVAALLQVPPEPSESRKKLVHELEQKLKALGPISFEVTAEEFDAKGAKAAELTGRFYLDLANFFLYFSALKRVAGEEPDEIHMFSVIGEFGLFWSKSECTLGSFGSRFRRISKKDFDIRKEVNAFFGKPPKYKDFQSQMAALRSMIQLDVDVNPNNREKTECTIRLGTSDNAMASWLKDALEAPEEAVRRREGEIEVAIG